MLLAFLTLSALDVLDSLIPKTTAPERAGYIDWIYHCQVPTGGFRGYSGTDFGAENRNEDNQAWDPANVPATFFALVNLLILGDDLGRVKRRECLDWLPKLQRSDGSFGEVLGQDGKVEGNRDLRYCCCAAGIRYILRGSGGDAEGIRDIDVNGLILFIQACQVCPSPLNNMLICGYGTVLTVLRATMVEWPNLLSAKRIVCALILDSPLQELF